MRAVATALALSFLSACTPQKAPLTLYDDFAGAQETDVTTHGELVEGVLLQQGLPPGEISRRQVTIAVRESLDSGLEAYVRDRFLTAMRHTTERLEDQGAGVVSQSQGVSDSRVVAGLIGRSDWRAELERQLGLSHPPETEFLQALCDRVSRVRRFDPQIQLARQELLATAREASGQGVARFISAGNNGELARQLEQLGVETDPGFYLNYLADPSATVVGAADHGRAAGIASPHAGAEVAAQGVDVEVRVDGQVTRETGSSYATPQVAHLARQGILAGIPAGELEARLTRSARPVAGAEPWLGAGTLNEDGFWLLR